MDKAGKTHVELEVSVHKLERKNKELRKALNKDEHNNRILLEENKKLQDSIRKASKKLKDLGEEALIPVIFGGL